MVKFGPRVAPANMFVLSHDEAYAGTSISEWQAVIDHLEFWQPVELNQAGLNDIKPKNQECVICKESFLPSDDRKSPEKPVSLPCGHIFGMDCLSDWIAVCRGQNPREHGGAGETSSVNISVDSSDIDNLLPNSAVSLGTADATCPLCRQSFTVSTSGDQGLAIEARLRFWDFAYEKLGILRSVDEEECRRDLWRFVEKMKAEQKTVSQDRMHSFDLRAQVSALRFALRRARWELTPVQRHLRDAFFNLGCSGMEDSPNEYSAESYEGRPIPFWCWQFGRIERGMSPNPHWTHTPGQDLSRATPSWVLDDWTQQHLGPWRRKLFTELEEDRLVYQSTEWWESWYSAYYVDDD